MNVVKTPGPDHPITVERHVGRVQARFNGVIVADSTDVLMLKEAHYKAVAYFPRTDADMTLLARSDLDTYCPFKGHAAYFSIAGAGATAKDAVWTYEAPHPAMAAIEGRLAFYPNVVEVASAT